ncbi:MAG: response regulator [Chloroflexi bacterium]|nr:response regulator [Chloroflexota bacterium]
MTDVLPANLTDNRSMTTVDKARILIVEDERTIALTLAQAFRRAPDNRLSVDVCYTASEALALLPTQTFQLVLCDLRLPGMSGLELIAQIRHTYPTTRTILMTGFGSPEIEAKAKVLTDAYLAKPFEMADMLKIVQELILKPFPIPVIKPS